MEEHYKQRPWIFHGDRARRWVEPKRRMEVMDRPAYAEIPAADTADDGWEEIERNWGLFTAISDTLDGHYHDRVLSGVF